MTLMELMMSEDKKVSTKVVTGRVRLSYANVWVPKAVQEGQEPKYSVALLIPKQDKVTIEKFKKAIALATENGKPLWGGKVPPNLKNPMRDGDVERPDDPVYKGHMFVNASSSNPPDIVDRNRDPIIDKSLCYSGCYARVSVNMFAFNKAGNRGIGAGLNNIQVVADGPRLGGKASAEEDFDVYEDEDEFLQ